MIDLRELLDERSANPPTTETPRLTQIQRRITRRRRARIAAIAAVVLLLSGGYLLRPTPHPAPPAGHDAAFPAWQRGARLVATHSAPLERGRVSVTWTPKTLDIEWAIACSPPGSNVMGRLVIGETRTSTAMTCGGFSRFLNDQPWRDGGFKVGEPATLTVDADPAGTGTLALAVYERVPFHEFPLPPRPDTLKSLDCPELANKPGVHSDPGDPLKPMSMTIEWAEYVQYHVRSQTPGFLHVAINGVRVGTREFWDYEVRNTGGTWEAARLNQPPLQPPQPGDRVTITLTPEHVTGAWVFNAFPSNGPRWSSSCPM